MYATKSFCNILELASNEPGENSIIGELTTQASTFSRELGTYHHSTIDGYDLVNFYSRDSAGGEVGQKRAMHSRVVDQAVAFVDLCVRTTVGTSGEIFQDEIHRALVQLAETQNADSVKTGPMVTDGERWVPRWITWHDVGDAGENEHIVWLAVEDFMAEYPDYEIVVVPPVDNLDSFFFPGSLVETMVKAITPTQMMERAEEAKSDHPTTWMRSDPYQYQDPLNTSRRIEVYWTVLGYGDAGNDPDIVRDALVDYILSHSEHTRDDWAVIFPDIFKRTEFIFTPMWDRYAADARIFDHGIYSPIVDHGMIQEYAYYGAAEYPVDHVAMNTQVFSFPYRSITIASIGHTENRDGKVKINQHYADFMSVPTTSTDFGRMSTNTQRWAQTMMELLILAESWTNATRFPRGFYKVQRGDRTYISTSVNRVLMLVLVKNGFAMNDTAVD